ncbi:hypothetical protein KBP51_06340 [Lactiplantibacillus pentosus]|uniref:putative phage abortive infection protein n=1 Tax=Lactiplantibacillus pentosus TaxID=1589 RepID=UPI00132FF7CC|nr:putative phage abortive infection protein [Lactiplantibacillus pentosus]MBQ0836085.1 hypothetical protein [Lactiplantibacillus pentosus]
MAILLKYASSISALCAFAALIVNVGVVWSNAKHNDMDNFKSMFFHLLELLSQIIKVSGANMDEKLSELQNEAKDTLKMKKERSFHEKQVECTDLLLQLENIKLKAARENEVTLDTIEEEFKNKDESTRTTIDTKLIFIAQERKRNENFLFDYDDYIGEVRYWKDNLTMSIETKKAIDIKFENIFDTNDVLTLKERQKVISAHINFNQNRRFFEVIHSMIKLIGKQKKINRGPSLYIGILRTQLSEQQLLLLYYIAEYTEYGQEFKQNVRDMNLWGDTSDLNFEKSTYFNQGLLVWSKDLHVLKSQYTSK